MNDSLSALILAAGKSTRMKSQKSKVVHNILGKAIIEYVVDALSDVPVDRIAVVVNDSNFNDIKEILGNRVEYIFQKESLGTGHAVMVAEEWLSHISGDVFVVVGDAPFITGKIMRNLYQLKKTGDFNCTFLTAIYDNPPPYGRVVRKANGNVAEIVEEKDASEEQKQIKEVSSSHYCFDVAHLLPALKELRPQNTQREYYLTDVIASMGKQNLKVETLRVDNPVLTFGVNNRRDLADGISFIKEKINRNWMNSGVTIIDSSNTFIESKVNIAENVTIYPFTYLAGETSIGKGSSIGPFVYLENATIPALSIIKNNIDRTMLNEEN